MLRISKPWDSQPQEVVGINSDSPQSVGLLRWWPLNGLLVEPIRGNEGPLSGDAGFVADTSGRSLALDGTGDYVLLPSAALGLPSSGFSFSAWVYPTGSSSARMVVLGSENNVNNLMIEVGGGAYSGAGTAKLNLTATSGNATESASGAIAYNAWNHIAGSHPGGTALGTLYVNGVAVALAGGAAHSITNGNVVHAIGRRSVGSQQFSGRIQDLRIYGYVLPDSLVWQCYANRYELFAPRTIWVPVSAGGGGTSISGALGTAVASGFTGTINANRSIAGALGTATASGFQGGVSNSTNTAITGALGVATASGFKGTVGANRGIAGALGTAVASGFTGAVTNDNSTTIVGAPGTATASGFTGAITWNRYISGLLGVAQASGFAGGVQNGATPAVASGGGIYPTPRRKTKQEIDADRKRLGILPDEPEVQTGIVEVPKRPTITLEQLIGKPAADTHRADMERASAAHKLRKRRQDDDLLMMM